MNKWTKKDKKAMNKESTYSGMLALHKIKWTKRKEEERKRKRKKEGKKRGGIGKKGKKIKENKRKNNDNKGYNKINREVHNHFQRENVEKWKRQEA